MSCCEVMKSNAGPLPSRRLRPPSETWRRPTRSCYALPRTYRLPRRRSSTHSAWFLGYTYTGSPIVAADRDSQGLAGVTTYTPIVAPGHRLSHVWVSPGHALYDDLGSGFTLLHQPGAPGVARLVAQAARGGVPLQVVATDVICDSTSTRYVLVRPDQHIPWCGDALSDCDLAAFCGDRSTTAKV